MPDLGSFAHALITVATVSVRAQLVRIVPNAWLSRTTPPNFLFASGKPNRFNPPGVECIYFSEDDDTALNEYLRQWRGTKGLHQPRTTFYADVRVARVVDLTDAPTLSHLGLTPAALHEPWRTALAPTATQTLGHAVSLQTHVSAIRYPSDAAHMVGVPGTNVVVFRAPMRSPDRLRVLGPTRRPLQSWP
jgi:RES domain-containing protein